MGDEDEKGVEQRSDEYKKMPALADKIFMQPKSIISINATQSTLLLSQGFW